MSKATLDDFLAPTAVKAEKKARVCAEEKCSDCGVLLDARNPKYDLTIRREVKPYCRECARKRLPKPKVKETQEEADEE